MDQRAQGRDGARAAAGDEPERTCAVTRAKLAPEALIRFVADPTGCVVPDLAGRLPGRGVWVACSRATVETAARTNAFARSLKHKVSVPDGLAGRIEALMVRRAMDALSLANKAGQVVPGFTKAEILVGQGEALALVHAREAADDGAGKLDRRLRAVQLELGLGPVVRVVRELGGDELSLAMGRPHVVHAALRKGGAAENFLREAGRLRGYRTGGAAAAEPPDRGSDTERA
jgi:hypothetical protein